VADVIDTPNVRAGMQRWTFRGDFVAWDYWHCKACGATTRARAHCDCDRARLRPVRRARRLLTRARQEGSATALGAWLRVLERDPCSYCGAPSTCIDHVLPLAQGGTTDDGNLVAACTACNTSKRDRPLIWWLADRQGGAA
jgi:5-methylcytosine-specific restriction endonuclease McrA